MTRENLEEARATLIKMIDRVAASDAAHRVEVHVDLPTMSILLAMARVGLGVLETKVKP